MEILKEFEVSFHPKGEDSLRLILCFDSGSPYTFIKKSSAKKLGKSIELDWQEEFLGLGGNFSSKEILLLHIKVLNFWCRQVAYVITDEVLDKDYDILVGHDFMQTYGIKLIPPRGDIEIDEARLRLSQKIR